MGTPRQCFAHGCDDTVVCQVTVVSRATIDIPDKHMGSLTRSFCAEHGEQVFHVLQVLLVEGIEDQAVPHA